MEKLYLNKLSQAILNTKNKVQFCAAVCAGELGEDEIDGLSRILEECCEEMEQAANTIDLLRPTDYAMQRKGGRLRAVPFPFVNVSKINSVILPENGNGAGKTA